MANYTVSVYDSTNYNEICADFTPLSKIEISINGDRIGEIQNAAIICLDISSAIKFSKELRRQIALAKEQFETNKSGDDGK